MARFRPVLLAAVPLLLAGCAASPPAALPSSSAAPTTTAPAEWTAETLWATCAQEWDRQHPGIDWEAYAPIDADEFVENPGGLHYAVRYPLDDGSAIQARNCLVGGTPEVPSVYIDPPLDDFDPSAMPEPSSTFAVR